MIKPISPNELKIEIPDYVIEGVNNAIKKKYRGQYVFTIKQKEMVKEILKVAPEGVTSDILFKKRYLDIEQMYRDAGWEVEYDKPGYSETYDAFFKFKIKPKDGTKD